ncbi:hypothetical protein DH2020_030940 [Rehmannia glutinosa]|uniref:RRM domain-containing protein n=1 Tax=Rehmannia glutinosa TaxID=99300 RepID=A0ABR0VJC4_REHGL
MRPIFCGNFEYDARQSDLERDFRRYGKVDRVDMKSVCLDKALSSSCCSGRYSIGGDWFHELEYHGSPSEKTKESKKAVLTSFGRVLCTQNQLQQRTHTSKLRQPNKLEKALTLQCDVVRHPPLGSCPLTLLSSLAKDERDAEDAIRALDRIEFGRKGRRLRVEWTKTLKALDATNLSKLLDRVITVEYAVKDDDDKRNGYSPDRNRDRSPRRGHDRVRSPSPYRRERESPDYGHGRGRKSPSPYRRERASPEYTRGSSRSPSRKERDSERARDISPSPRKERDSDYHHKRSPSPQIERSNGDSGRGPNPEKKVSPDYGNEPSPSPRREHRERVISPTDDYARDRSPAYSDAESPPPERYGRYAFISALYVLV